MIDLERFKEALAAGTEQRQEQEKLIREAHFPKGMQSQQNRRYVERLLRPMLTKAGVNIEEVEKLVALSQTQRRQEFEKKKEDLASYGSAQMEAFQQAAEERYKSTEYLNNLPQAPGGLGSLVSLTTPFLIWEWPHLNQSLVRSHIEPLKSYAKFLVDIPAYSFDNDSGNDETEVGFYFYWENNSDYVAIAKCFSVVGLHGACDLEANTGFLSGDEMVLSIDAWLYPISYWLPLPPGGNITSLRMQGDPLQHQQVLTDLTASGGSIIGDPGNAEKIFTGTSYGMSYGSYGGLSIPGRATAIFEVNLKFSTSWQGNTLPDEIKADFADDRKNYRIECPIVVLQFLTAPPMV